MTRVERTATRSELNPLASISTHHCLVGAIPPAPRQFKRKAVPFSRSVFEQILGRLLNRAIPVRRGQTGGRLGPGLRPPRPRRFEEAVRGAWWRRCSLPERERVDSPPARDSAIEARADTGRAGPTRAGLGRPGPGAGAMPLSPSARACICARLRAYACQLRARAPVCRRSCSPQLHWPARRRREKPHGSCPGSWGRAGHPSFRVKRPAGRRPENGGRIQEVQRSCWRWGL